jgi:hypothetical protein
MENGEWRMENNSTNSGYLCEYSQFSILNSQLSKGVSNVQSSILNSQLSIIFTFFLTVSSVFAFIAPGGYSGYSYTPAPGSVDKGEVGYAARFDFMGSSGIRHSVVMRPLTFLELGVGISKEPVPAAKIILPFYEEKGQGMAFGFTGERLYFTGMMQNISEENTAYNLTLAGIYDTDQRYSIGSITGEANIGYASLSLENFFYQGRYGAAATFTLKPFAIFDMPSYLETSTGVAWRSPDYTDGFSGYTAVQVKMPLLQADREPVIFIDINPAFDHSVSFARHVYPLRLAFDMDAVLVAPFDFYLVGALSPSLKTQNQDRLPKRDILDRYYLLWDSEKNPSWAACGMLNTDIYGCQTQLAKKIYNRTNPVALILGYTRGDQSGINAISQIPLHPSLSGDLSKSLLFAEGGLFLGEKLAAQLNFRQGTEKKHLQIGSGYDFDKKSIFGELSLQYDFSISKQVSGAAVRLAPNLRHRENSDFYVFDYDVPIYQEGNNGKRLHNFPWKR